MYQSLQTVAFAPTNTWRANGNTSWCPPITLLIQDMSKYTAIYARCGGGDCPNTMFEKVTFWLLWHDLTIEMSVLFPSLWQIKSPLSSGIGRLSSNQTSNVANQSAALQFSCNPNICNKLFQPALAPSITPTSGAPVILIHVANLQTQFPVGDRNAQCWKFTFVQLTMFHWQWTARRFIHQWSSTRHRHPPWYKKSGVQHFRLWFAPQP